MKEEKKYQKAILIDAMLTVFVPTMGRWHLYKVLLKKLAGIEATEEKIKEVYQLERAKGEGSNTLPSGRLPRGFYRRHWSRINAALIKTMNPAIEDTKAIAIGEQIFLEVMGNPSFFTVSEEVRRFLEEASLRDYVLYLVTNQEEESVWRLIKAFGVSHYFKGVVVSDTVGYQKPDPRFFTEAIRQTGFSLDKIAFLGNNPRNDMEGAEAAGISYRFLFDPAGEHSKTETKVKFIKLGKLMEVFNFF